MSDMKEENSKYKDLVVWQKSMTFANVVDPFNWTLFKGFLGSTLRHFQGQRQPIGSFELSRCQVTQR